MLLWTLLAGLTTRQHAASPTECAAIAQAMPADETSAQSVWSLAALYVTAKLIVNNNKYVRLRGRPYIHTCRSYVHTPRDFTNGASLYSVTFTSAHSTVMFTCGWAWPARLRASHPLLARATGHWCWPTRPILGFWGSKVPPKCVIPCLERWWTAVQNLTPDIPLRYAIGRTFPPSFQWFWQRNP